MNGVQGLHFKVNHKKKRRSLVQTLTWGLLTYPEFFGLPYLKFEMVSVSTHRCIIMRCLCSFVSFYLNEFCWHVWLKKMKLQAILLWINFFQLRKYFRKFILGLNVIGVLTSYMSYVTCKLQVKIRTWTIIFCQIISSFAFTQWCQLQKKNSKE